MSDKEPLWSPDKNGEYHLGDLMYNLWMRPKEKKKGADKEEKETE